MNKDNPFCLEKLKIKSTYLNTWSRILCIIWKKSYMMAYKDVFSMQNVERKTTKLLKCTTHSVSIESTFGYDTQYLTLNIQFCTSAIASESNIDILFSNRVMHHNTNAACSCYRGITMQLHGRPQQQMTCVVCQHCVPTPLHLFAPHLCETECYFVFIL